MLVQFRNQSEAIPFDYPSRFDSRLVVGEAFFQGEARHPHIDTRLPGIASGVFREDLADSSDQRVEQHNINLVMVIMAVHGPDFLDFPKFHPSSATKSARVFSLSREVRNARSTV